MSVSFGQRRLNKSLSAAIYYQQLDKVKELVGKGADVNRADGHYAGSPYDKIKSEYYGSPLYGAVERGSVPIAEFLLSSGADPNKAKYGSLCALLTAAESGNAALAALLLKNGADPEAKHYAGQTALLVAAEKGAGDVIEALVAAGADVNAKQDKGVTALHLAAEKGFANIVRFLLDHGADPDASNSNMNTPADVADKDYPRIGDVIRAKSARRMLEPTPAAETESAPAAPAEAPGGWKLTAPEEVARVAERAAIGYCLTEIFNFESSTYTRLARNLGSGAESQAVRFFDEIADRTLLDRARAALESLGGRVPEGAGATALDKPVLAPRPPGGPS